VPCERKENNTVYVCFFENPTNPKDCSKSTSELLFQLALAFLSVHFKTIFRITGGSLNDFTHRQQSESWNKLPRRIFRISERFHRSEQKLYLNFLHRKAAKYCENHQCSNKVLIIFTFRILKQIYLSINLFLKLARGSSEKKPNIPF
jgi:hypothetical protein